MRIVIIRRKWFTALGCACAAALILWVVGNPSAIGAAAQQRALPIYSVEVPGGEQVAAITFDAAWDDVRMRQFRLVSELPHFYCFYKILDSEKFSHTISNKNAKKRLTKTP